MIWRKRNSYDETTSYTERPILHGAGVLLKMPLNERKKLESISLETLSNDVVIGLMGLTLES